MEGLEALRESSRKGCSESEKQGVCVKRGCPIECLLDQGGYREPLDAFFTEVPRIFERLTEEGDRKSVKVKRVIGYYLWWRIHSSFLDLPKRSDPEWNLRIEGVRWLVEQWKMLHRETSDLVELCSFQLASLE